MLHLKQRQVAEESTENWDDDDFEIGGDSDFMFPSRTTSVATSATRDSFSVSRHRDSIVSRLSMTQSDFGDDDEDRQLQAPQDDERSKEAAIANAARAGIPIPQNIPASALLGGTIKRLGGRKVKKIIQQDDWDDDLVLPGQGGLQLKRHDASEYPDALRHVSGQDLSSPFKPQPANDIPEDEEFDHYATIKAKPRPPVNLDMFKDDDDDDFFGGRGGDTLKVSKKRLPRPVTVILPPTPSRNEIKPETNDDDDFESAFQIPGDNKPLRLSIGKEIPKTPGPTQDEFEEWTEGSLGTRYGGTRRSGVGRSNSRSARSSSASGLSPSVSSTLTYESEDEGLDGIIFPSGPCDFGSLLKKRQQMEFQEYRAPPPLPPAQAPQPEMKPPAKRPAPPARLSSRDDFLSGLDLGDGDVFDSNKLTLNRNVKVKTVRQTSPQRPKASASLKFTDKPAPVTSRLPRPLGHERHSSNLDPVCETGAPSDRVKRTRSKLGGGFHTPHSSISSIPTPQTSSSSTSALPTTPRRRGTDQKPSLGTLRGISNNGPTTTNAQLLKVKRSMPVISNSSPARPLSNQFGRPPSRDDPNSATGRLLNNGRDSRAKTPTERERERSGAESGMGSLRRQPPPFLPGGSSSGTSHHVTIKTSRHFRQNDSMSSNVSGVSGEGYRSTSRTMSRTAFRSPSPATGGTKTAYTSGGSLRLRGPEALAREAATKRQITKPTKKQHFGDGRELDGFDDLPTSSSVEQKFVKVPVGRGPPRSLRNKVYQTPGSGSTERTSSVAILQNAFQPKSPQRSPQRNENRSSDHLPSFARDTNASRMARQQVLSQRTPSSGGPLSTLTNQWKREVTAKTGIQPASSNMTLRPKKTRQPVQKRPHLIKPLNDIGKNPRCKLLIPDSSHLLQTNSTIAVKGMTYNPTTFRWEGNENDPMLSPFDLPPPTPTAAPAIPEASAPMPDHVFREKESTTPRPALITNINASQGVQIVGGMVFDPQRMCWLKVPSKRGQSLTRQSLSAGDKDTLDGFEAFGNEEDDEDDVFKDVPDLEDRPRDDSPAGLRARDSSRGGKPRKSGFTDGAGGGLKDDWLVGEEFDVGPEFVRRQREEEERWRRKVEKWVGEERQRIESNGWRWRIRDVVNEL